MSGVSRILLAGAITLGCASDIVLVYEGPRLVFRDVGDSVSLRLSIRKIVGGTLSPIPELLDRVETCPCEGRSVDLKVLPLSSARLIAVGVGADGRATRRAITTLPTSTGLHTITLQPIVCGDEDGDGFCPDEPAPIGDCNDADPSKGPIQGCEAGLPQDADGLDGTDPGPPDGDEDPGAGQDDDPGTTPDPDDPGSDDPGLPDPGVGDPGAPDPGQDEPPETDPGDEQVDSPAGELGDPCVVGTSCASGHCVSGLSGQECSQLCDTQDCPPGYLCGDVPGGDSLTIPLCVTAFLDLCTPCIDDEGCLGYAGFGSCESKGPAQGSFCAGDCSEQPCPAGFECGPDNTCQPIDGACPCSPVAVATEASTPCTLSNEYGSCSGWRTCGEGGLSECDALTPAPETCDGVDNDCNGDTDDAFQCTVEPCEADPVGCTGSDPCVDVICEEEICGVRANKACFGSATYLGQKGTCQAYWVDGAPEGVEFCRVPSSLGLRGAPGDPGDPSAPEHLVFEPTFLIQRHETRVEHFSAFLAEGDSAGSNCGAGFGSVSGSAFDQPVLGLCRATAKAYCEWSGAGLPTESQWERAARGVQGHTWPWGPEEPTADLASFQNGAGPLPAGSHPLGASMYGVQDLAGNVAEWVADDFDPDAWCESSGAAAGCDAAGPVIATSPQQTNAAGCEGACAILRGGSFSEPASALAAWSRRTEALDAAPGDAGIRCARSTEPPAADPPVGCCAVAETESNWPVKKAGLPVAPGPEGGLAFLHSAAVGSLELATRDSDGQPTAVQSVFVAFAIGTDTPRAVLWPRPDTKVALWEKNGTVSRREIIGNDVLYETEVVNPGPDAEFEPNTGAVSWGTGEYAVCTSPGAAFRVYAAAGELTAGLTVAGAPTADQCALAALADGNLAAVWRQAGLAFGRIFDPVGDPLGVLWQVEGSSPLFPSVAELAGGRLLVASVQAGVIVASLRSPAGEPLSSFSAATSADATPPRLAPGAGPWAHVWWAEGGSILRRGLRAGDGDELGPLTQTHHINEDPDPKATLHSLARDRHARWVTSWTDGSDDGRWAIVKP